MKKIKIKDINQADPYFYLLVDTAFSHQGDIEYIKQQIDDASSAGVDGVKFQILLDKDNAYSSNYQVYESFDKWMFSEEKWFDIITHAKEKCHLEVIVLPIDEKALDFCIEHKELIDAVEVHSINFNQRPFLEKVPNISSMVILGIGGRTIEDIDYSLDILKDHKDISVIMMHGFQSFPTNYENIKLNRVKKIMEMYDCIGGYADHTYFDDEFSISLIEYAYLSGARVFEKHLVLEKGKERVDYEAAVEKEDMIEIRDRLGNLIKILDEKHAFVFTEAEIKYRNREKQLVCLEDIMKGEVLNKNNIGFKVNGNLGDFEQRDYDKLIGKKAIQDIRKNTVLKAYHVEYDVVRK